MNHTPSKPLRPVFPALLVAATAALAVLAMLGTQPLQSTTYWWHIAIGEFIQTWQVIPAEQVFLYTLPIESPWVYTSWLGSILLYNLHELAGPELTLLVRNVFGAISVAMVAFVMARRHDRLYLILLPTLVIGAAIFFFANVGPSIVVLPIATAGILGVYLVLERPDRYPAAMLLPLATLLSINIDFATALVLIIVGAVLAISLFRRVAAGAGKPVMASAIITATTVPAIFGFAYGPSFWPAALSAAATTSLIPVFAVLLSVVLATVIVRHGPAIPSARILIAALVIFAAIAIALQPGVDTRTSIITNIHDDVRTQAPQAGIITTDLPIRCAEELRRTGRDLRIYHEPTYAGFLLYHLLRPENPVPFLFTDHRNLIDDDTADMAELIRTEPVARGLFQQNLINAAVVDRQTHSVLVEDLIAAPDWHDLTEQLDHQVACFIKIAGR